VAFSSDGARVATASRDGTVRIWDGLDRRELVLLCHEGKAADCWSVAFSSDNTRVVTACGHGIATVWDVISGREIFRLRPDEGPVSKAAFSPEGDRIVAVAGGYGNTVLVWRLSSGAEIVRLLHNEMVRSAAFSPEGNRIVTGSLNGITRVWNAESGAEIIALHSHPRIRARAGDQWTVYNAMFTMDGTRIITACGDGTARVWDSASGAEIGRVTLDAGVTALAVHESTIVLGDRLGRVHVFDDTSGSLWGEKHRT
jgi:WD40 repeat protein